MDRRNRPRRLDVIVSMGCGDACPIFPGKRYEDWDLDDPSNQPIDEVRRIRDQIRIRVEALIASLELATVRPRWNPGQPRQAGDGLNNGSTLTHARRPTSLSS
jgi:hypothetical protein